MEGVCSSNFGRYRQLVIAVLATGLLAPATANADGWRFWKKQNSPTAASAPNASPAPVTEQAQPESDSPAIEQTSGERPNSGIPPQMEVLSRMPLPPNRSVQDPIGIPPPPTSIEEGVAVPIDLVSALQLAGVRNLDVLIAQQRVLYATAQQQLAAAQALPNLNLGGSYDQHTGNLQQASGNILNVDRSALYLGSGADAVAAGSVNIPGLQYNLNVGEAYYSYLASRQLTQRSLGIQQAANNDATLRVAATYLHLVEAEGQLAIAKKFRDEAAEIARITDAFATTGQGRHADAERATTVLAIHEADVYAASANVAGRSAELVQLLNLEHSMTLKSTENWVIPRSIVPAPIPLPELIAIALYQRPEVASQRASVHAAMLNLKSAKVLPFSPQVIAGFSTGMFGGGSDLAASNNAPLFGNFDGRLDTDLVAYWSIRNLGLGNKALIDAATARLGAREFEQLNALNQVRADVAVAYASAQTRFAQLSILNDSVKSSTEGLQEDFRRTRGGEGLPIELLDSLRLASQAQINYLHAIIAYNASQYELYRALGNPPADLLVRPVDGPPAPEPTPTKME